MSVIRNAVVALTLAGAFAASQPSARAGSQTLPPINVLEGNNVAIHGYDPVAYFVEGKPHQGSEAFSVERGGARWLFANARDKTLFESDPDHYTPAYGGYCAFGAAQGHLVKIDPEAWTIVNNKLYLNYSLDVRTQWKNDIVGNNGKADINYPKLIEHD